MLNQLEPPLPPATVGRPGEEGVRGRSVESREGSKDDLPHVVWEQERREAQWASLQVLMARLGGREEVSAQ